ncbi:calumenin-like isoform X2 [Babylonia areolata]|uniref:calumenin-like isoform X2 n=1 Tax=Babylonia areolata TaxID=304850 RepID=UPI003FD1C55E
MSRLQYLSLVLAVLAACTIAVPTDKKQRSLDKSLSDIDHEENGEHNADYDHDAFLGHEDKKTFDQLSPEESKERLAIIIRKIDKNNDGYVTEDELQEWIQYVQKRYIINDTDRMWKDHHPDEDNTLSWPSYQKRTFGYDDDPNVKGSRTEAYADMINRDRRRWDKADKNRDGRLSKEEFMDFLHPEDAEHMRDIVVMETIEDIDKDKDGMIDLEEYIADMWPNRENADEEPDWVKSERKQFHTYRDQNKDGKLDSAEVKRWILPDNFDHARAESKHLIYEGDGDKDGKLSHEEILEKYDLFVGSQATDFGEALTRHDEF